MSEESLNDLENKKERLNEIQREKNRRNNVKITKQIRKFGGKTNTIFLIWKKETM